MALLRRAKRLARRALRTLLYRYARARPRDTAGAERRVVIVLSSGWGMGGTIRAAYNLAGHLASNGYDVEILSIWRRRDEPFFGSFPPGVRVRDIDDVRPGATPLRLRPVRALLRSRPSILYSRLDRFAPVWTLWADVRFVRRLHRGSGILVTTRPGLNMLVADLRPPGWVTVGLEQMNLGHHRAQVRAAIRSRYARLDTLVALTGADVAAYDKLLDGNGALAQIPNTVHPAGGAPADTEAKIVLAAGRLVPQKGFDYLIDAYSMVARDHPDWRLRVCGNGEWRERLAQQVANHGLDDLIELAPAAANLPAEMERASVFVLSSRYEGFPLVLLEAMSKGMAAVAFDCPTGPADIIQHRVNGILVPPRDVERLAEGIRAVIEDPALRRQCATAGMETAAKFTIAAVGPRWEALFDRLWRARSSGLNS